MPPHFLGLRILRQKKQRKSTFYLTWIKTSAKLVFLRLSPLLVLLLPFNLIEFHCDSLTHSLQPNFILQSKKENLHKYFHCKFHRTKTMENYVDQFVYFVCFPLNKLIVTLNVKHYMGSPSL